VAKLKQKGISIWAGRYREAETISMKMFAIEKGRTFDDAETSIERCGRYRDNGKAYGVESGKFVLECIRRSEQLKKGAASVQRSWNGTGGAGSEWLRWLF